MPALRSLLAQWLGVDRDLCEVFIEAEAALLSESSPDVWELYHQARGKAPAAWLARIEQPTLMRACPLPLRAEWVSSGIGEYRPVEGTFGGADIGSPGARRRTADAEYNPADSLHTQKTPKGHAPRGGGLDQPVGMPNRALNCQDRLRAPEPSKASEMPIE